MEKIKPIETEYNGYRFRSRLEARWAVFFDAIHMEYVYEPEGFELSKGERYLPDFYLPSIDYYVEVKGFNEHIVDDIIKVEQFVREKHTAVIILSNVPYKKGADGLYWFRCYSYTAKNRRRNHVDAYVAFFDEFGLEDDAPMARTVKYYAEYCPNDEEGNKHMFDVIQAIDGVTLDDDNPPYKIACDLWFVEDAMLKARQARFEYGETPS